MSAVQSPYMAGVRDLLREAGFDMSRQHEESFVFAELAGAEPEVAAEAARDGALKVTFSESGRVIDCPADMNVLEAARRAGFAALILHEGTLRDL